METTQTTEATPNDSVLNADVRDINSLIEVVDAVPSHVPTRVYDQVKIYVSGATKRFYIYDQVNHAWLYSSLT